MLKENRYYSRIAFVADAQSVVKGVRFNGHLLDLSLRGALLRMAANPPMTIGATYPLKIYLPSSDITLHMDAELVHHNGNHVGMKFRSLDLESLTHLRKLLDLNADDREKLNNEMEFWLSQ